jgi:hypothetical protein
VWRLQWWEGAEEEVLVLQISDEGLVLDHVEDGEIVGSKWGTFSDLLDETH